jgi:hypothetical protein
MAQRGCDLTDSTWPQIVFMGSSSLCRRGIPLWERTASAVERMWVPDLHDRRRKIEDEGARFRSAHTHAYAPIVAAEEDGGVVLEVLLERHIHVVRVCAAPTVDRLIGIPDNESGAGVALVQLLDDLVLGSVGVLRESSEGGNGKEGGRSACMQCNSILLFFSLPSCLPGTHQPGCAPTASAAPP